MPLFKRKLKRPNLADLPLQELLNYADTQEDPQLVFEALSQAETLAPDNLEVQHRLLLHGRLHERNPKKPDFHVIKCYLLDAFLHPQTHPDEQRQQMARELFDHPRLVRCLALAPDGQAFLASYLLILAQDYLRIFVLPDSRYLPRLLGLPIGGNKAGQLARPVSAMIKEVFASPFLNQAEKDLLAQAQYKAYLQAAQGAAQPLHGLLGAEICSRLKEGTL